MCWYYLRLDDRHCRYTRCKSKLLVNRITSEFDRRTRRNCHVLNYVELAKWVQPNREIVVWLGSVRRAMHNFSVFTGAHSRRHRNRGINPRDCRSNSHVEPEPD